MQAIINSLFLQPYEVSRMSHFVAIMTHCASAESTLIFGEVGGDPSARSFLLECGVELPCCSDAACAQ